MHPSDTRPEPTQATLSPTHPTASEARALGIIRKFGRNTTSHQAAGRSYRAWFHPSRTVEGDEAVVAFVDTGRAWVAAGDPTGPGYLTAEAARAFVLRAEEKGRRAAFVAAEVAVEGLRAEPIGLSAEWDPAEWDATLRLAPRLREQLRRARAKGVRVRFLEPEERDARSPTRQSVERLAQVWLEGRRAPALGFLTELDLSDDSSDRELVVAERDGELVAAAVLCPIVARRGFLLEHLLRSPRAPNGTAESLVDAILKKMHERGERVLSLGTAPLAGECAPLLRWVRRMARGLYDFDGLFAFKARLRPTTFRVTYLVFPTHQTLLVSGWDTLTAFAGANPITFLLRSLLRRLRMKARGLLPF